MTTKRASLPGAEELFRKTGPQPIEEAPSPQVDSTTSRQGASPTPSEARPRHEEKVTFYCTPDDLTRVETARLALRAKHRIAADRGKVVRAALAEILDDFESRGTNSALVRRLTSED